MSELLKLVKYDPNRIPNGKYPLFQVSELL